MNKIEIGVTSQSRGIIMDAMEKQDRKANVQVGVDGCTCHLFLPVYSSKSCQAMNSSLSRPEHHHPRSHVNSQNARLVTFLLNHVQHQVPYPPFAPSSV